MRCYNCGKEVVRFPIRDDKGKLIIKNLFKMDAISIIMLTFIVFLTWSYMQDTGTCRDLMEKPCDYVEQFQCSDVPYTDGLNQPINIENPLLPGYSGG